MKEREVWDAVDASGKHLGFDLYRDEAEQIPAGVYHTVAEIYSVTKDGLLLNTLRDPKKPGGLKWEVTGGSVVKGETPLQGAVRELKEETGLEAAPEDLILLTVLTQEKTPNSLYYEYAFLLSDADVSIQLQPGETVDHRFVSLDGFLEDAHSGKVFMGSRVFETIRLLKDYLKAYK